MELRNFPNPKLNLLKEFTKVDSSAVNFENLENYIQRVKPYMYTEINLDYQKSDPRHRYAWVQRFISSNLLRSLYLRNSVVEALNSRNTVALYALLKSWYEILGVLCYVSELLERDQSPELEDLWCRLLLGNKGEGSLRVGEIEGISVATFMKSADKYMKKMVARSSEKENKGLETFLTDLYDVVNNNSHPAFDSNDTVESLEGGVLSLREPDDIKKLIFTERHGYSGVLSMTVLLIPTVCKEIFESNEDNFLALKSRPYFA